MSTEIATPWLFVIGNLLLAAVVAIPVSLRPGARQPWHAIAAGLVLAVSLSGALILAQSLVGRVSPVATLAMLTALLAIELGYFARRRPTRGIAGEPPSPGRRELLAGALLGGIWLCWLVRTAWLGGSFIFDDLTYHAAIPGYWLQRGGVELAPFTYQAYYPLNAELTSYWFMLLTGTDAHSNLAIAIWISLALCAALALARGLSVRTAPALLLVAAFAASPRIVELTRFFATPDLAAAGAGLAAFAFAARPGTGRRDFDAALCGLAAGFGLGAKVAIALPVAALGVFWVLEGREAARSRGRAAWRQPLVYVTAAALTGSYWYLQNWILTGNPVFPAALGPFEGPLGRDVQHATSLLGVLERASWEPAFVGRVLLGRLDWPLGLGLVALAGHLLAPLAIRRAKHDAARRRLLIFLLATSVIMVAAYPGQPFSGTINRPNAGMHHQIRYLTFPFLTGLLLLPAAFSRKQQGHAGVFAALFLLLLYTLTGVSQWSLFAWAVAVGISLSILLLARAALASAPRSWLRVAALALLPVALAVLALRTPAKAVLTARSLYGAVGPGHPLGRAWRALERLPAGARVGGVTNAPKSHEFFRPLFGRSFQLEPVVLGRDGARRPPLHERWRAEPADWWWEFRRGRRRRIGADFVSNLRESGVQYVLVSRWGLSTPGARDAPWPPAREALLASGGVEIVYADGFSEIHHLIPERISEGREAETGRR